MEYIGVPYLATTDDIIMIMILVIVIKILLCIHSLIIVVCFLSFWAGWRTMLVVPELEREVELLWELRDTRKVLMKSLLSNDVSVFGALKLLNWLILKNFLYLILVVHLMILWVSVFIQEGHFA